MIFFNIEVSGKSAINFKLCVDDNASKNNALIKSLSDIFETEISHELQLVSIRNPKDNDFEKYAGKEIKMEQRNQKMIQILI